MSATLRKSVGSLMVMGVGGLELTALERAWLKLVRPGGIILFRRNIAEVEQTRALLREAASLCAEHSLRCVDVEGGTVDRLRDALAPMPSAQAVYLAAQRSAKPALMREHGELIARAVRAFGFNTTLAPVLDLALPASAGVMGTRAVSPTAAGVVEYARNFLAGLATHGIVGCGKHFPGLGAGTLDSHVQTPRIVRGMMELNREDILPYQELSASLPMVMVSHAAYPKTPGKAAPASVSPYWITTVLRKRLGYKGIVFSDDLEMGGILNHMPIEEAAIAALRAGIDMIEICHSPELILRAYEALLTESERSAVFRSLLLKRAGQLARKRKSLFATDIPKPLSKAQFERLRGLVNRFQQTIADLNAGAA